MSQTAHSESELEANFGFVGSLGFAGGDQRDRRTAFWISKRLLDIAFCVLALPLLFLLGLGLVVLNRFLNPGPLLFTQTRMGQDCQPFTIYKFRTMLPATGNLRGPEDPVEAHRITPFGAFLRRSRLDETPQFLNVLVGDMSLIGPRPDVYTFALQYLRTVPHYRRRHQVRPGITGFAQVTNGYVETSEGTIDKARRDLIYIHLVNWRMEFDIALRTLSVIFSGKGAR